MANGSDSNTLPSPVPASLYPGLNLDVLDRIVEDLVRSHQVGSICHRPLDSPRYVSLRSNKIFARLVGLYTDLFTQSWSYMKHAAPEGEVPTGFNTKQHYMATIYISAWFWDLYATIRQSVHQLCVFSFNEHFQHELYPIAGRFDPFLNHLNTIIRPTQIHHTSMDALFIPTIASKYDWDHETRDYFGIAGFTIDENALESLLQVMERETNPWRTIPLATNTHGRPGWLFDYRLGLGYAWFPRESNFSRIDLVAPYILGIPCTPRIAPRDADEWQYYSGAEPTRSFDVSAVQRVTGCEFYGNAEYRTVEYGRATIPIAYMAGATAPAAKRPRTTPQTESADNDDDDDDDDDAIVQVDNVEVNRYRVVDWCYYAQVILGRNDQIRNDTLRRFLFCTAPSRDGTEPQQTAT